MYACAHWEWSALYVPHNRRGVGNVDVFEVARHREPVSVRRPPTEANETNLREFNQLKNKGRDKQRETSYSYGVTPGDSQRENVV